MQTSRRKRVLRAVLTSVTALLVCLAAAELVLRVRGVRPWRTDPIEIRVEPGGSLFRSDPKLGYTHMPGKFKITLADGYTFGITHGADTLRITSPLESAATPRSAGEIWIFGCSFTHGWCLADDETFPWLLQEAFPEYRVVNFGTSGYGTIHALIQLQEALASKAPKFAVLAYADFHDNRNTFLRLRGKTVAPWNRLGPVVQPYARFDGAGNLQYGMADVAFAEFPLMRVSALSHYLEINYDHFEERLYRSHDVSKALVAQMARISREHGVTFVVAGIAGHAPLQDMLAFAKASGIAEVDMSVDLHVPGSTNAPHDNHPSARSNKHYADTLGAYLRTLLAEGSVRRGASVEHGQ